MDYEQAILVSCRMTPAEVAMLDRHIARDGYRSRNQWLRELILGDIAIAADIEAGKHDPAGQRAEEK